MTFRAEFFDIAVLSQCSSGTVSSFTLTISFLNVQLASDTAFIEAKEEAPFLEV